MFLSSFMPVSFEIYMHVCIYTQCQYLYQILTMCKSKIIYIWHPYLSPHIYDPLNIPCLAVIFVLKNAYKVLSDIHKYFTFGSHIFFFHIYDHLCIPCLEDFFSFVPVTFEIVHTCVSINNINTYTGLSKSQIFYI